MRRARSALLVLAAFGIAAAGFRSAENRLLFPAPPAPVQAPAPEPGVERAWLEIPDGRVEAFLLAPLDEAGVRGPLLVYAHGNGELVDGWLGEFGEVRSHGVSVLLVEYPGYGRSEGTPSEASIRAALVAGYDWAVAQPQVDAQRVIGHGRSLGGGAICSLARERALAALVMESTFTSVRDAAADAFGVPRFLVRDVFDNRACLATSRSPVLVLHGDADGAIPVSHARRLAATNPAAELQIVACGHNDCPPPWPAVVAFLRAHGLL
ncbi:MAG TPA: alpha/beta hydrolase [Myxococcota bacterium]|nr:alpha/beta hydrolase [Myxococcota bacterium]